MSLARLKQVPPPSASTDQKRQLQRARAREFGVEALEGKGERLTPPPSFPRSLRDYGDPVNLMYPLKPDGRARNARTRFKQFADRAYTRTASKRIVHTRIVERLLAIGARPSLNEEDKLDRLLPAALRRRMRERLRQEEKAMSRIPVTKAFLLEGEELQQLIKQVMDALGRSRQKLGKSLGIRGIFKDHVIACDWESGKFFKMAMTRDDKSGVVSLGDAEEVRQVFVPVHQAAQKAEGEEACAEVHQLNENVILVSDGKADRSQVEMLRKSAIAVLEDGEELHVMPLPEGEEPLAKGFWKGIV